MKSLMKMKNVIICDFDETITNRDTISILGQLPYYCKPGSKPEWSHFTDTYMQNYERFHQGSLGHLSQRSLPLLKSSGSVITTSNFKTFFEDELNYQKDARRLEMSSTNEMAKYGIFANITFSDVSRFAKKKLEEQCFSVRKGFNEFMLPIPKDDLYVISVNWSGEFIEASIGNNIIAREHIYCNQLLSANTVYTGDFSNRLLTGADKVDVLEDILTDREPSSARFWYIGDSETDLLNILHPEVNGVLLIDPVQNESKFKKLSLEILGLNQKIIDQFIDDKDSGWLQCYEKNDYNSIFLAKSWSDLKNIHL